MRFTGAKFYSSLIKRGNKPTAWTVLTCETAAPVSRILFLALSGSPALLFVTGIASMVTKIEKI